MDMDGLGAGSYGRGGYNKAATVTDAKLLDLATAGADWLGGGTFGPEGSVVATCVLLVATLGLWRAGALKPGSAALDAGSLVRAETERNERKD